MSGFKDIAKGGWHPKGKDGQSKESWRGDFKGVNQVAGWMGKGKGPETPKDEHISRPLATLKDPSAFGPPPKNVNYHGGAALPHQTTPDTRGLGAPLSKDDIKAKQEAEEEQARRKEEEAVKSKGPPVPFRVDTTGLRTTHLPPPPGRKDGADGRSTATIPVPGAKPKPSLPPRLPPRQASSPASAPSSAYIAKAEPEAHKGVLNQGALSRLGGAGVSVPGFGIGNKPTLPPPRLSSPSRNLASSQAPEANSLQLNELQSRFSHLSSSASPKSDSPSEGTSFAQKQAALKTASNLRNDPSKVSLSDARAAASTANNFRERHGEQVKSGWQSANRLNTKYGIADKVGSYGGVSAAQAPDTSSTPIEMRDNSDSEQKGGGQDFSIAGKKKAPPPPVKRAALTGSVGGNGAGPLPPPIPLSSKPKPQLSSSEPQFEMQDLDLDLKSLWFVRQPADFPPPSINRLPGKRISASSSGWSSSGVRKTHTFTGAIRDTATLGTTIIQLTWDGSNPGLTVRAKQRHIHPPRQLSRRELDTYKDRYSDAVASWSESRMGKQVGNGECWTLANDALTAVAAQHSARGQEPCMPSQSYIHGHLIYSFIPAKSPYPVPKGGVFEAGITRGDVIQLLSAHFKGKDGSQKWAGAPDHTAVITGVGQNGVLNVVEQNVGGAKTVRMGEYDVSEMTKGEVRIFRAVGESWVGKLDPSW